MPGRHRAKPVLQRPSPRASRATQGLLDRADFAQVRAARALFGQARTLLCNPTPHLTFSTAKPIAMQKLVYTAILTLLFHGLSGRARAQPPMDKLRIAPELTLALDASNGAPAPGPQAHATASRADREAQHKLRRSRIMAALGVGLTTAGVIGLGVGLRGQQCYDSGTREANPGWAITGGALTTVGLSLSISGMVRLAHSDRTRAPAKAWLAAVALGALGAGTAIWFVPGIGNWVDCISS